MTPKSPFEIWKQNKIDTNLTQIWHKFVTNLIQLQIFSLNCKFLIILNWKIFRGLWSNFCLKTKIVYTLFFQNQHKLTMLGFWQKFDQTPESSEHLPSLYLWGLDLELNAIQIWVIDIFYIFFLRIWLFTANVFYQLSPGFPFFP